MRRTEVPEVRFPKVAIFSHSNDILRNLHVKYSFLSMIIADPGSNARQQNIQDFGSGGGDLRLCTAL